MEFPAFAKQVTALANRYACLFFAPCFNPLAGPGAFYCMYRFPTDLDYKSSEPAETAEEALRQLETAFREHYSPPLISIN